MHIDVKIDDREAKRFLRGMPKKIPYAIANATNATVLRVYNAERREMQRIFDRPTPWILGRVGKPGGQGGMAIKYASVKNKDMSCFIRFRGRWDSAKVGASAEDIILTHINGGTRPQKRGEKAIEASGKMKGSRYYMPGSAQNLNQYGNITKGMMTKIMSATRTHRDVGAKQNAAIGTKTEYFIHPNGSGIYRKVGKTIKPVLIFARQANCRRRFNYFGIAERNVKRWGEHNMTKAIKSELYKMRFSNVGSNLARS